MTGKMLHGIESVLEEERPDVVMVYGDTNSTLAAGLAASKLSIPVIHVEAGLRSFDRQMPEEMNRIMVDLLSKFLFCPTDTAVANLRLEGIFQDNSVKQFVTKNGDVMYDTFSTMKEYRNREITHQLGLEPQNFALATIHLASNTDTKDALEDIMTMFAQASSFIDKVVFPVHPRTRARMSSLDIALPSNVLVADPLSYLDVIALLNDAAMLLTDSGGMQKEALWTNTPCITLRETTEWVETCDGGFNYLVGRDMVKFGQAMESVGLVEFEGKKHASLLRMYGDGQASRVVAAQILELLES